ncbi:MAG: hypothetical protein ACLQOO_19915, partial [Terriglobia bacterium]
EGAAYANTAGFAGTLAIQYGVWGRAGISTATAGATVSNAYAGYFDIFNSMAGTTITNAYGVYIANSATTGTITNRYDLYASSANGKSYFAGNVGIGTTTPAAKLEVNGTTKFDQTVTFASGQAFPGALTGVSTGGGLVASSGNVGLIATCGTGQVLAWSGTAWACATPAAGGVSQITAGTDVTISPLGGTGNVTVNVDTTKVPQLVANNSFTGNESVSDAVAGDTALSVLATGTTTANTAINAVAQGSGAIALNVQATDLGLTAPNTAINGLANGLGGAGVVGEADTGSTAVGVYGISQNGLAGFFQGNVDISGSLSKSGGSFKIDDPIDPANKYLYHSFVESPDMKNIYDGVATLDALGEAVVQLPDWFGALNKDFRYQLTCIGGFAPVYIAEKINQDHFKIAGGKPGLEVSWQVTGTRQDAWANAHRIPVEVQKPAQEQGYYIHPELFGQPAQKSIEWVDHPQQMKKVAVGNQ